MFGFGTGYLEDVAFGFYFYAGCAVSSSPDQRYKRHDFLAVLLVKQGKIYFVPLTIS